MRIKHIIYLASGAGRRFGENKLLCDYHGKPLYRWGLETIASLVGEREDCRLTVVSRYPQVRTWAEARGIPAVDSPESERGISHTIRAGIRALGELPAEDYLIFAVADQPNLRRESLERLLAQTEERVLCASLCWGDRPGNPALFSADLIPELLALEGDRGGRAVLRRHDCVFVPCTDPAELEDIDTKADIH